jgi:hypothetical protein
MDQATRLDLSIAELLDHSSQTGLGTAFCIAPHYWITAHHVVAEADAFQLALREASPAPTRVVARVASFDVALLYCETPSPPLLVSRSLPGTRSPWRSLGYPLPGELRHSVGTRLPIGGVYEGATDQSSLHWIRSEDICPGVSGAPVCSGEPTRAWAFVSQALKELFPGRGNDYNLAVSLGNVIDALADAVPEHDLRSMVQWAELAHDELRGKLESAGWTALWHSASDPAWRKRSVHPNVPYFVRGDRPSPVDIAQGDIYPRRNATEAAAYLMRQDGASVVVVRGDSACGKSSLALLIAWEMHQQGVTVLEALPDTKSIRALPTEVRNRPLLLLIEDAHSRSELLERLKIELQDCAADTHLLIVSDLHRSIPTSAYYLELTQQLERDGRLKVVDAGASFFETQPERVSQHIEDVFKRWQLRGHVERDRLDEALQELPVARSLQGLFTTLAQQALAQPEAPVDTARPPWLTQKLMEWTALSFAADVVLPLAVARRAAALLPEVFSDGSYHDVQWTDHGFSYGHSQQASAYPIADRVDRELEVLDAALGTDQALFLASFVNSVQPGTFEASRLRLGDLPDGAELRASEAALITKLHSAGKLDGDHFLRHLERLRPPTSSHGLLFYGNALGVGLTAAETPPPLFEGLMRRLQEIIGGRNSDAYWRDPLARTLFGSVRDAIERKDWQRMHRVLESLRDLAGRSRASEEQRTWLARALSKLYRAADAVGDTQESTRSLSELRQLTGREQANEEQRDSFALSLYYGLRRIGKQADVVGSRLLAELRLLAGRPQASEEQRTCLSIILLQAYLAASRSGATLQSAGLLDELRVLASRAGANETHRTCLAHALSYEHNNIAAHRGKAGAAEALLCELRAIVASDGTEEQQNWLARSLFYETMRLSRLKATKLESVRRLLEELRNIAGRDQATLQQYHRLAGALSYALDLALADRDCASAAEDMLDELRRCAEGARGGEVERTWLARSIYYAVKGATDAGDLEQATERLDELRALATRSQAADEQRTRLAQALCFAHDAACTAGNIDLAATLLNELQNLAASERATEGMTQCVEMARSASAATRLSADVVGAPQPTADQRPSFVRELGSVPVNAEQHSVADKNGHRFPRNEKLR